jgi:hypothetical protein
VPPLKQFICLCLAGLLAAPGLGAREASGSDPLLAAPPGAPPGAPGVDAILVGPSDLGGQLRLPGPTEPPPVGGELLPGGVPGARAVLEPTDFLGHSFQYYLQILEQWVGREVPEAIVHSTPMAYTCRRPVYDGDGRAVLDARGRPLTTLAAQTGRLFLPARASRRDLPLVVFVHATTVQRRNVASNFQGAEWIMGAAAAAFYGIAVAMPDLPGLGGDTTAYHPFCHATSVAYAVVDAVPAAVRLFDADEHARDQGFRWNGRLHLLGYSSGGFGALAAAREIEAHPKEYRASHGFTLAGTAAMGAPFDLSGAMRELLLDPVRLYPLPYFVPHMILGFHSVYGRAVDPAEILAPVLLEPREDGNILEWVGGLMDAMEARERIGRRLGAPAGAVNLRSLLNPVWVERQLAEPGYRTGVLRRLLEENDVSKGWTPTKPILLVDFPNDDCVPNANNLAAYANLSGAIDRAGGDPRDLLVLRHLCVPDLGITHITGALVAIPTAFQWFDAGMPRR